MVKIYKLTHYINIYTQQGKRPILNQPNMNEVLYLTCPLTAPNLCEGPTFTGAGAEAAVMEVSSCCICTRESKAGGGGEGS
jgi:hypothetical protein